LDSLSPQPDDRVRRWLHYLRIGFSGLFATAAVLVFVLWVLSYFYVVAVWSAAAKGRATVLMSESGCLILMRYPPPAGTPQSGWEFWGSSAKAASATPLLRPIDFATGRHVERSELPFTWQASGNTTFYASVPHWSVAIFCGIFALAPWIRLRFSLRTLLIAMTVVALGICVAVMKLRGE
jgi:hypothetical protein